MDNHDYTNEQGNSFKKTAMISHLILDDIFEEILNLT